MSILNVNCNARLLELLSGQTTGKERSYIYTDSPRKKLEHQIFLSKELVEDGYSPYIEVKFVSQYSSREKRIEVVGVLEGKVVLYKFSSRAFFDKDANELARLIEEIKALNVSKGYDISGTIILLDKTLDLKILEKIKLLAL